MIWFPGMNILIELIPNKEPPHWFDSPEMIWFPVMKFLADLIPDNIFIFFLLMTRPPIGWYIFFVRVVLGVSFSKEEMHFFFQYGWAFVLEYFW